MKFHNILKFIILILITNVLNAQDFYTYKLFNNKFQVIFPGQPYIQDIPEELINPRTIENSIPYKYKKDLSRKQIRKLVSDAIIQIKNSTPYAYTDIVNKLSFTAQSLPSQLEHKNYIWHGIKKLLDGMTKDEVKANNYTLINFSSSIDKKNDTYIAIYTSSYFMEGQKVYSSVKKIYHKEKIYSWDVRYINKNDKKIFDSYKQYCKVIK